MSQFDFLAEEFPEVHARAVRAEETVYWDTRVACFYGRFSLEAVISRLIPTASGSGYGRLAAIDTAEAADVLGRVMLAKAQFVRSAGNRAVHERRPVPEQHALAILKELYDICIWVAESFGTKERPNSRLRFDLGQVPRKVVFSADALDEIQKTKGDLEQSLQAEIQRREALQVQIAGIRDALQALTPDLRQLLQDAASGPLAELLFAQAGSRSGGAMNITRGRGLTPSSDQSRIPEVWPSFDWEIISFRGPGSHGPEEIYEQMFMLVPPKGFRRRGALPEFLVLVDGAPAEDQKVQRREGHLWLEVSARPVLGAVCFTLEDGSVLVNLRTEPLDEAAGEAGDPNPSCG